MKIARLNRFIELKATAGSEGKPRRFAIEAYDGGPLPVDGFDLPVIVDLTGIENQQAMPLLIDHEGTIEATLGDVDTVENTGQSLSIGGVVTGSSEKCQLVLSAADKGQRWQASIGCRVIDLQEIKAGQLVTVNKQSFRGPVLVARKSQWYETSVLPAGADWTTTVNLAAKAARLLKGTAIMPSFEDWCKSINIDPATLSDDDRAALTLAYDAKQAPPKAEAGAGTDDKKPDAAKAAAETATVVAAMTTKAREELLAGMRKTRADEDSRIAAVELVTVGHPEIRATAIREGWDATKAENAALKAQMKTKSPPNTPRGGASGAGVTPQILEAAVCMARKIPGHEKRFDEKTLQAAHEQFRGGIGLQQLILHAACANGYEASPGERVSQNNIRRVLRAAFAGDGADLKAAAFTTVSLPGILSNVANKELLAGYEADEQLMLWKEIAAIKSVSDFKTVTSYRLLDNMTYEELGPGGKIKSGTLSEESYTRQAKTYAKMAKLDRTDIINDDLGALDDLRTRLGLGAATKLSDVFWTKFLDNSSFFTSGRANYISGATTNLGTDAVGLQLGLNAFRTLRSPSADGSKRVGGEPALLLVPTELAYIAEQFYVNLNLGGGTTVANANIHAKKYRPIVVPWLSDTSFTGYSTTAWYLLRDKARYASMVVSFLDGIETPTVETAEADFDELGVQFRGYHDFGCDQAEYLAGVKSKGAA